MFGLWTGFICFVLIALALDLGVFHRKAHAVKAKEAFAWTGFYVGMSLLFTVFVYALYQGNLTGMGLHPPSGVGGKQAALEYLSGYLIEESLSIDNIFVIALILTHFKVPAAYQHRVLFWGVLGVLVMRGVMITVGLALFNNFHWMTYVFGGLLLFTAVKMFLDRGSEEIHPDKQTLVRLARRLYPVSTTFDGPKFFTRLADGRRAITPMFLVLLTVEMTDLIFALDSIPAVFAVTQDAFLVFTSNVFAILGLRSLFFAVHDLMGRLRYMKLCLVVLLFFIGVKMTISQHYKIPIGVSLGIIALIIAVGVGASLLKPKSADEAKPDAAH
jgi:tellurite resistance protein TerC